ncbi:zinc finger protein Noc [Parasteatoda tepidariorum]|uniref:zinc finger protein Noc n=1 Tax=Parasteatoda tepidariorum TaxID=114398 RepID=UPI00077F9C21|nr:zinc finger protein Noc [Parasteatoda tepidariorum]
MLNGNQYLRPEYLSPLSTTLDTKKSPLALLAQTCNSIGANIGSDNPNNKHVISGLEKTKDSSDSKKDKSPVIISDDHSNSKPSFKPYESVIKKEESDFNGKKTPNSKTSTPSSVNHISPAISTGSCGKSSPDASENGRSSSHKQSESTVSHAPSTTSDTSPSTLSSSQNTLSGLGYGSSSGLDLTRNDGKDGYPPLGLSAYKGLGLNPLANCNGCGPIPGHGMDAHAFQGVAQSGLLKANGFGLTPGLSPYLGYARLRTASGGHAIVPVCRDPSCTNCQYSMQGAQLSPCPSGCTQCTHDRLGSVPGLGQGLVPGLNSSVAAMAAAASMSGLYPPSLMSRPNVCSWVVGDTYCGKRFSTSEELLQHLRTHTNLPTSEPSLSLLSPAFSLASSNLNAACHMHFSSPTTLTSPAGLRRTYPTSLSPVSSLSAANRYHPYKPTLSGLPGAPIPQLGHPGLGVYYPYSLYGQRLGPPVHP